jgi:hypothetical protein
VAVDPRALDDEPVARAVTACEELAELLGDARRAGFDPIDLDLVRDLLRTGSPAAVAAERKVTTRTVRNHRDRVTYRLRRLAEAA